MDFTEEMKPTRELLRSLLNEYVCEVKFTKVDGTERTMPCTLKRDALPAEYVAEEYHSTKVVNPDTMSAFCTDKNAWRSLRIENVKSITILKNA